MKTITVGDIHGSTFWKDVDPSKWDKIIFMGDYVDHWTYTDEQIFKNLVEIIDFKKKYPEKVVLLVGNHDARYMFYGSRHSCSGFRYKMYEDLHELFNDNKDLFKLAYYAESEEGAKFLWTHAGICTHWYMTRLLPIVDELCVQKDRIDVQLNVAFKAYRPEIFDCGYDRGGNFVSGGPLWADKGETQPFMLPNIEQIVGHSKVEKVLCFCKGEDSASITYVDTLESDNPEFYELTL